MLDNYLKKNPRTGKPTETVEGSFGRVAMAIAAHDEEPDEFGEELLEAMLKGYLMPNRPCWFGAPGGMMSACTAQKVRDSLVRGPDSILRALMNMGAIQQAGSGCGQEWSDVRPPGSIISRSGGSATGVLRFLKGFNSLLCTVQQGGFLQGANQAHLLVTHPESIPFTEAKLDDADLDQYNTNIGLTDEFFDAVMRGGHIDLTHKGKVYGSMDAREMLHKVGYGMWKNGGLGVQYASEMWRRNALPGLGSELITNPCGEFSMFSGESCCPGYVNLAIVSQDGVMDWEGLRRSITTVFRMLDDLVDANGYIPEVHELEIMAKLTRRVGVSPTAVADMCVNMGVLYGSPESLDLGGQVMEFILFHAIKESVRLASIRGPFPSIENSIYNPRKFRFKRPIPLYAFSKNWGRPALNWRVLIRDMRTFGVRNCGFTTSAPGSWSRESMPGIEGYGIEPVFAEEYTHGGEVRRSKYVDKENFVTALEVLPEQHLYVQAAFQRFVTEGIAKTINAPHDTTQEQVEDLVVLGATLGLMGMTFYRTGSREYEVFCPTCQTLNDRSCEV